MPKRKKKQKQKLLNGADLADFVKVRHAHQVRRLSAEGFTPHLAIIQAVDDPRISAYVGVKQRYAGDIGAETSVFTPQEDAIEDLITELNENTAVNGIIVQLPLPESIDTDKTLNSINSKKDVDGLGDDSVYDPATQMAIMWLFGGYNINLKGKTIVVVGQGRLVGGPLTEMLQRSGHNVVACDESTDDLAIETKKADVLVTATGQPSLITSDIVKEGAVIIDAGVATDSGELVGDVADEVYERSDIKITPKKGGVGPLTVAALFDNLLRAAEDARGN